MRGFVPARRVPFVSAKRTKTIFARARSLRPCSEAGSPGCLRLRIELNGSRTRGVYPEPFDKLRTGLVEGLKQPSPKSRFGAPAPPRPRR